MVWQRWLPDKTPTFAKAILAGSAAAAGGTLLRFALQPALGSDLPFVTFFPLLLAAATWGGMRAGVICLALSCAASMTFFLPDTDLLNPAWSVLAFLVSGGLLTLAGSALGSTVLELRENQRRMMVAESDLRTLVSELTHRSRNGLTVIIAIVNQSARKAETARELAEVVNGRLGAMAEAQGRGRTRRRKFGTA